MATETVSAPEPGAVTISPFLVSVATEALVQMGNITTAINKLAGLDFDGNNDAVRALAGRIDELAEALCGVLDQQFEKPQEVYRIVYGEFPEEDTEDVHD